MQISVPPQVPGTADHVFLVEIQLAQPALQEEQVMVTTQGPIEAQDIRGGKGSGAYVVHAGLQGLHIPFRVTEEGEDRASVEISHTDATGAVRTESREVVLTAGEAEDAARQGGGKLALVGLLVGGLAAAGIFLGPRLLRGEVRVPEVSQLSQKEAEAKLEDLGIPFDVVDEAVKTRDMDGRVVDIRPQAGALVEDDQRARLIVGRYMVRLTSRLGESEGRAVAALEAMGLIPMTEYREVQDDTDYGVVIGQSPGGGEDLSPRSTVTLVIGRAPRADTGTTPPDTTQPDATQPDATQPDATQPDATQPDATQPDATQPDATQPDATQPDATQPNATQPDATQPDATQPDTTLPDATQPDATQPDATQPDTTLPDATQPDATQPDATQPDTTLPDATQPDATQPDTTQPDATQPDATQPDATQPDATQPDTTQPDATQPDATPPRPDSSTNPDGMRDNPMDPPPATDNGSSNGSGNGSGVDSDPWGDRPGEGTQPPVVPPAGTSPDRPAPDRPDPDRPAPDRPAPDRTAPPQPAGPVSTPRRGGAVIQVPTVVGQSRMKAQGALRRLGLRYTIRFDDAAQAEAGQVVRQEPTAGTELGRRQRVTLYVARQGATERAQDVAVPDVVGLTATDAAARLRQAGFVVRTRATEEGDVDIGVVVRQSPVAGARTLARAVVEITIRE